MSGLNELSVTLPCVERPWLKYYSPEEIAAPLPAGSIYEYMHSCNAGRMDEPAVSFMGQTMSHRAFDDKINACARALTAHGVRQGDIVSVCMLTMPEALVLLFAINRIGAVCSMLVFNASENELHMQIAEAESRIVFTVDMAAQKIKKAVEGTKVTEIVHIPIYNSMAFPARTVMRYKTRKLSIPENFISWGSFLESGNGVELPNIRVNETDLAVLEYTSGTTGDAKGAMLTNLGINSAAFNYGQSGNVFEFHDGERFLSIVCPFFSFGLITTMIMPLCTRLHLILSPDPNPKSMPGNIRRYKPNHFCSGSLHIDAIIHDPKLAKMDLSFISTASYGGEKSDSHWEKSVSEFFFSHGMKHKLVNGYGMTEACGSFCTTTHKTDIMIPFAKNNVLITDMDTDEPLGYDAEGQICISGPSLMAGYYKKPEETAKVMFEYGGATWLKTGDLGRIAHDGSLNVTGRIKRVLYSVGENGVVFRIFPMKTEEIICSCNDVLHCGVVGRKESGKGDALIAYIVPKSSVTDTDGLKAKLEQLCESGLSLTSRPVEYNFIKALPTTRAGKVDYKELERMANS